MHVLLSFRVTLRTLFFAESSLELYEGDEPDPYIGVIKYRLLIKGYRGENFAVVHKVSN